MRKIPAKRFQKTGRFVRSNMFSLFEKDAKLDTFVNPTTMEHLDTWRQMYNLSIKEVREAIIEYGEKLEPEDNKGIDETSFVITKLIEDFIKKNGGPKVVSVTEAINKLTKHLNKIFFIRLKKNKKGFKQKDKSKRGWTIEQVRLIHKRLIKENYRIYIKWLTARDEHLTQNEL